ncbi:MAG TPA: lipase family protein [Thermoanaerobaculia bacterium]|jgi:hypothetical protein|nr:lipase family protein [Thermoanaerobaculia bacterium]
MDFDNSWDALVKPGLATNFFDLANRPRFEPEGSAYSAGNAWWLAEISRLIYRQGTDEVSSASGPTRVEILKRVGLGEVRFVKDGKAQCAIIEPPESSETRFRILVFRGSHNLRDWFTNLQALPTAWPKGGKVHEGFRIALDAVWDGLERILEADDRPTFYTGHSLGAALATLAASRRAPRAAYTFGSPFVGDQDFQSTLSGTKVYRVINNRDVVTTVPPWGDFVHVGEKRYIMHDGQIAVDPTDHVIALDRAKRDGSLFSLDWHTYVSPPEYMADHAPVNYVAHLERAL